MTNLEHKLTVDDLIVEYMMYKVRNGYEPSFLTSEFISFLYFFESKMEVQDALYENDKLFKRFFERKNEADWSRTEIITREKIIEPHMDVVCSETEKDYIIKANYKLSDYDRSVINTYFMDNGMGKYEDFKGQTFKIREIIGEYLKDFPKRKIDENIEIKQIDLTVGKYVAAEIISNIWDIHIKQLIEYNQWPSQCHDINKFLLKIDLAKIIGLKSIRNNLIEIYNVISKKVAILYHQDRNLKISSCSGGYLAKANYELIIQGYEKIMKETFSPYTKSLHFDLSTSTFIGTKVEDGIYPWDEEPDAGSS